MTKLLRVDEVQDCGLETKESDDGSPVMQDLTYVSSHTIVPEDDGVWLPASPNLAVDTSIDVVVQEVENRIYGNVGG